MHSHTHTRTHARTHARTHTHVPARARKRHDLSGTSLTQGNDLSSTSHIQASDLSGTSHVQGNDLSGTSHTQGMVWVVHSTHDNDLSGTSLTQGNDARTMLSWRGNYPHKVDSLDWHRKREWWSVQQNTTTRAVVLSKLLCFGTGGVGLWELNVQLRSAGILRSAPLGHQTVITQWAQDGQTVLLFEALVTLSTGEHHAPVSLLSVSNWLTWYL